MEVVVKGCRIHVEDIGSGPTLLFLHGIPESSDAWRDVVGRLKPHFRCIAPDLPGFGHSSVTQDFDMSPEGMAAFIDGLVEALRIRGPLTLVVHDMGGPYGLSWAVTHPKKVARIVIMNTFFFSDVRLHTLAKVWRIPVLGELSQLMSNRLVFKWELRRSSRKLTDEQLERTYQRFTSTAMKTTLRLFRSLDRKRLAAWDGRLQRMAKDTPMLVLWGDQDPYFPVSYADRFGTTNVHHFADCGHWPAQEESAAVAMRIASFVGDTAERSVPVH